MAANYFEALLSDEPDTEESRKALAGALRRQDRYSLLGSLMNEQPTIAMAQHFQGANETSLKGALAKQQAAKEAEARAAERRQAELWQQQNFDQRERGIEATRINQAATRAGSGPIIDTEGGGKVRVGPDNNVTPIIDPATGEQVKGPKKPPTEGQSTAGNFARQYEQSLPVVLGAIDKGYIPSHRDAMLGTTTYENAMTSQAARAAMTDEGKEFYDAAKVLINAVMRRESGAAISASEWQNAFERWLPRPGDSPELVAQKRARLEAQLANFIEQAGPAYEKPAAPDDAPSSGGGVVWERGPDGRPRRKP